MQLTLYKDSSMILRLEGLQDHEGNAVEDAVVTASLSKGGTPVLAAAALAAGGGGDYEAVIAHDLPGVAIGDQLLGTLVADWGGLRLSRALDVRVRERK